MKIKLWSFAVLKIRLNQNVLTGWFNIMQTPSYLILTIVVFTELQLFRHTTAFVHTYQYDEPAVWRIKRPTSVLRMYWMWMHFKDNIETTDKFENTSIFTQLPLQIVHTQFTLQIVSVLFYGFFFNSDEQTYGQGDSSILLPLHEGV